MFYLWLLLLLPIQAAQPATSQPADAKTSAPVEIPRDEVWEHMPADRLRPFLRVKTREQTFYENIGVQITVDREGNVVTATASRDRNLRLKLPPLVYVQAEAAVRELHFRPFERGGKLVPVTFSFDVSLLPQELKPTHHVAFPKVKDWKTLKIVLQRTGCSDACPGYTIELHADGAVLYTGDTYVAFTGKHRGTVPVDNVLALVKLFAQADYFSLNNKYSAMFADYPTFTTAIEFDGRRKEVVDYAGIESGMPMSIAKLEDAIDRLADSGRWTTGNSNTLAALQEERWDFNSKEAADTLARVARHGDADVLRDLLSAGVPVNGTNEAGSDAGSSALQVAAARGDEQMLRALLAAGAGADPGILAAATVRAAYSGKVEALRLMLNAGADIGARDAYGQTVLIGAAVSGSPEMVREVLQNKAEINAIATPPPAHCPPEEQVKEQNLEVCTDFSEYGRTALMEAVSQYQFDVPAEGVDRSEVVRLLLVAGADVNARDKAGNTALILCHCSAGEVLLLLQAGADPNAHNDKGETALGNDSTNEVKAVLLKHGAVPTVREASGK